MTSIEVFGPTIANIIRFCWFACGISFSFYAYKITKEKFDFGLVILCLLGPTGWLFVLFLYLFRPIVNKKSNLKDLMTTLSFVCAVLAILIPFVIIRLK